MKVEDLPDIGTIDKSVWSNIVPGVDQYGSSYSGAYSTVDGSRVEDITPERIARVDLTYGESPDGYADTDMVVLAELTDGSWAALRGLVGHDRIRLPGRRAVEGRTDPRRGDLAGPGPRGAPQAGRAARRGRAGHR